MHDEREDRSVNYHPEWEREERRKIYVDPDDLPFPDRRKNPDLRRDEWGDTADTAEESSTD